MQDEQDTETESTVLNDLSDNDSDKGVTNEVSKEETPEESARLALKELQEGKQTEGAEVEENQDASRADGNPTETKTNKQEPQEVVDPLDLEPPSRLSAKEKNIFNKLPKSMKPALARMVKEHQQAFTRSQTEYIRATQEARHVIEAVRPYYTQTPEIAAAGITESGLVAALVGAHQKLTNPETVRPTLTKIAEDMGLKVKFVDEDGNELGESNQPNKGVASPSQEIIALQNQIEQLSSLVQGERANAAAQPIVREFEAVRSQKDSTGRYLYPEMFDDAFWEKARPRISYWTSIGKSHGEALVKAHYEITERIVRPPAINNNSNNRAVSAAVSVRGRSAPATTQTINGQDIGANETPEQSARIALEELRRGMN